MRSTGLLLAAVLVLAASAGALWWVQRPVAPVPAEVSAQRPATVSSPVYVGRAACAACHAEQERLWQGSHHDLAMQRADATTVLGDFDNAQFTYNGVTSRFYREDSRFMVQTDGPDGEPADYEIKYTFGVSPLQQYLVALPGGRLQALGIAWDTRPEAEGGRRWFHLYPGEEVTHRDVLHWTKPSQNWNGRCAVCHSTDLQKNYNPASGTFETRWAEIDVSCEACHGPASQHVAWAESGRRGEDAPPGRGLTVALEERRNVRWDIDPQTGNAVRSAPRSTDVEIEVCAPCHSRRSVIGEGFRPGGPLLDHYRPALLSEDLYYPDGQVLDEVYVYGSFVQSRMYHAGVTCSDCHEPHSLQLRQPGNGVCLQCHAADKYNRRTHHFHDPGQRGSSCAECHMPPRDYMVVDARHDHSIRLPRPDLSVTLGVPNACTNCHSEQTAAWADRQVQDWYGRTPRGYQRFAGALAAAREGDPAAGGPLHALLRDAGTPAIARATLLSELGPYLNSASLDVIGTALWDDDPLVRSAAAGLLEQTPPGLRVQLLSPLLEDPVRAVRIEVARVLAAQPGVEETGALHKALREYIDAQRINADRPAAQVNLGNLHAALGEPEQAASAYRKAMAISPFYLPAYVNLADLYRRLGEDEKGESVLRRALEVVPGAADAHYALGLSLVRQKQQDAALEQLRLAMSAGGGEPRYLYTYAVALHSADRSEEAIEWLESGHERYPNDRDILAGLISFHRDAGNTGQAERYMRELEAFRDRLSGDE